MLDKAKLETLGGAQDHLARKRSTGSTSGHMYSPSKEGTCERGHNTHTCPEAATKPAQSEGSMKMQLHKRGVSEPAGVAGVEDRPQKRGRRAESKNRRLTNLDGLRLPTLRAICADLGLVTSGAKPEVMKRIQARKSNLDPLTVETLRLIVADRDKAFDKEWGTGWRFGRRYSDGSCYMGEFGDLEADPNLGSVGGKRHGKGTMTWPTGSGEVRYQGEWRDNNMHGQGTYTWASGARYEGRFRDGNMHGQGTRTWADGRRYEGEWCDDKMHGQGSLKFPNGNRYEGAWCDGKMTGEGTYNDCKGWSYKGTVVNSRPRQGVLTEADGRRYDVTYASDCYVIFDGPASQTKQLISAAAAGGGESGGGAGAYEHQGGGLAS